MKTNTMTEDKKYFVTSKVTCPECSGSGILSQLVNKQSQKTHTANLSSVNNNPLFYELSPCADNFTCLICDGSGQIKNDVPLKEALIETMKCLPDKDH